MRACTLAGWRDACEQQRLCRQRACEQLEGIGRALCVMQAARCVQVWYGRRRSCC